MASALRSKDRVARPPIGRLRDAAQRWLPRGDALPEETWQQRHRAILILLWLHAFALPIVGVVNDQPVFHAVAESSLVAAAAMLASVSSLSRGMRMVSATLGLVTSSALLVHFSGGLIEFHFHFFVIVAVITLYQSWLAFLVALSYVVLHHGVMGALDAHGVYNHPAAIANPWKWAFVHGLFILGESCALLVAWRMNENSNRHAEESYEQRLKEEHARYEAQEKYREIFDNSVEGIYEATLTQGLVTANPSMARMLGYESVEELLSEDSHGERLLINPEEGRELIRLIEAEGLVVGFEHEIRSKDGTTRWLSNSARAIRGANGDLTGVQGSVEDVTERRRAEASLREREEQFRILFESNPLPMWVYDLETLSFLAVNLAAVTRYGYSKEEFLAMKIMDIRPPEEVPTLLEQMRSDRSVLQSSGPWKHVWRSGEVREVEIKSHTLDFEGRDSVLVVVDDITDRNNAERQRLKLEAQLRQSQKMEAVGQLAGGIAHDFNNILSVVINYASFLKEEMDPSAEAYRDVSEIVDAGERGANLVRQILAFSRGEVVDPEIVNLNGAVKSMKEMLQRTLGEDIELDLRLADDLRSVRIDRTQVEQVLLNLAVNARDAMKQGGSLAIETSNEEFDDLVAEQHPELAPGHYVSISVSDTGTGMDEVVRRRIFEPFYTTKMVGEGTGLGLAMVYGVIQRANGHIYVYSEPSIGTRFRIYLPVTEETASALASTKDVPEADLSGNETVLLVEDEPAVRSLTARILERSGYAVVSSGSGKEALEAWRIREGAFDILLTDVIMPGMSGKELSELLRTHDAGLRVLFMSGYTDAIVAGRGMLQESEALVQKPFAASTLLRKLREVLDHSMSSAS